MTENKEAELKEIIERIEQTNDDCIYTVTFEDNEEFDYTYLEIVDESIYERSDLCVGGPFPDSGILAQFSIKEIKQIRRKENEEILFQKSTPHE
jgi:hypothetical protein